MASYLFDYSSPSSDHNDFNYVTPHTKKRVYRKIFNDDEVIDVDSIEDKVNDPGKRKTHSDDDVGFGWKNHDVHGDSDDSNDSFNGDDDEKINDENFIGNMNDVVPCVGMMFDSLDEAGSFYRGYGRSIGFKGGRLGPKPLEVEDRAKGKRPRDVIPRTCCRARMCVAHKVSSNKWEVTKVNLEHNHAMVTSDKTGFDSGDAERGLVLLRDLQKQSDGNFFYRVDVDEENRVRGLVWVDPRSLNAYKNFGDVVTFDSTYRTNRDEKETTYRWVLKTWLEAVDNKSPITIITDQDIALSNAISEKQKTMIPPDLVTMRWTINRNKVAGPLPCTPRMLGNVVESQTARYSGLCKAFQGLSVVGSCSVPRYNYLMSVIKREKEYVIKSFPGEKREKKINEDYESDEEDDPLLDPPRSQTKGRPKAGRFKSGIETSSSNKQF
ncbi:hypothetical protein AgCh_018279 [Apium graveolens]